MSIVFVEAFCGMAAVSLKLIGGNEASPPVSRHGAKTGYALSILAALGLTPGMNNVQIILNDIDPFIYNLWSQIVDTKIKREVVSILGKWDKCKIYRHVLDPESATSSCPHCRGFGRRVESKLYDELVGAYKKNGGLWEGPRGIAQWLVIRAWSRVFEHNNGPTMYLGPDRPSVARKDLNTCFATRLKGIRGRTSSMPNLAPVSVLNVSALDIEPIPNSFLYMDPPYIEGQGYSETFPREKVIEIARRWDAVGATVAISEADKVVDDWYSIDISPYRRQSGRRSKGFFQFKSREILTLNRMPVSII
jgi:hypothetical protein